MLMTLDRKNLILSISSKKIATEFSILFLNHTKKQLHYLAVYKLTFGA